MALNPMNTMDRQEFIDLCPAYALGALDASEKARFKAAAATADAEMRAALADALKTAANLSLAAPEATPSSAVKERLMARVRAQTAPTPRRFVFDAEPKASLFDRLFGGGRGSRLGFAVAFSMLLLAVGLVVYTANLTDKLTAQQVALLDTSRQMDALADSTRSRITALQDSLSQKDAMLEVIRSREMQMVAMGGMQDTAGYGKIIWDPVRKVAILQVSLPPEPEGMSYQLWVIRDNKPVDAGVFHVSDQQGAGGMYRIDQLVETDRNHINAFAVTMEPKGGMPQPTGKMYLMGEI